MLFRSLPSPDDGDALALTFAAPVVRRADIPVRESMHGGLEDYDPFTW